MSAVTITTQVSNELGTHTRRAVLLLTLPASYDAGGSALDLSALTEGGFTSVYGINQLSIAAANDKYRLSFVPGSAYAPGTGLVKIRDLTAASDAEASGDLSAVTVTVEAIGT